MIAWDSAAVKYNNLIGTSTFKGIEAEYKNQILADTLLSVNYTQLSAKDKDGFDLERRAKENLKVGIDYYGIEKFHFGAFGEYVGKRVQYTYGTHTVSAQTGGYTIANAVVNYDLTDSVQLYAKIDNIADRYYQTVNGYATSSRACYVGLKASF
jgi:vitamin B12 transporter